MKLVSISDTHEKHNKIGEVPPADVLIYAGDFTLGGEKFAYDDAFVWLEALPHEHKIVIPGNHDFGFEYFQALCKRDPRIIVLMDEAVTIRGLKFYGSPCSPAYGFWCAHTGPRGTLLERWSRIPHDTDVLITHCPPYGVLDYEKNEHLGCSDLRVVVDAQPPKLHVFGHIHEGYGQIKRDKTLFVNAAALDGAYKPGNHPVQVVEL